MATLRPTAAVSIVESESFKGASFPGGVVVVRWFTDSQPEEFTTLTRFILAAATAAGGPIDFIAVVSPTTAIPGAALRRAMHDFVTQAHAAIDRTHVVFVGKSGFWQTIARSITTSLMHVVGKHGQVTHEDTVDVAIARLSARRFLDATQLRKAADAEGLLDPDAVRAGRLASVRVAADTRR